MPAQSSCFPYLVSEEVACLYGKKRLNELTEAEVPTFFILAFTGKTRLQQSQVPESSRIVHGKAGIPSVEEGQAREHLNKWDVGPDEMHR